MGARSNRWAALASGLIVPWYEGDASFAWWPAVDTDTTQIDPLVGAPLARTSGTGAAIVASSGGQTGPLWALSGNTYANATVNTIDTAKYWLIICVVDTNGQASNGNVVGIGSGNAYVYFGKGITGSTTRFGLAFTNVGGVSQSPPFNTAASFPAGGTCAAHWMIYDPSAQSVTVGLNMSVVSTTPLTAFTPGASVKSNNVCIGSGPAAPTTPSSTMKHSAFQYVQRGVSIPVGDARTPGSALFAVNKTMRACNITGFI